MTQNALAAGLLVALSLRPAPAWTAPASDEIGPKAVARPEVVKACDEAAGTPEAKKCLHDALTRQQPEAARFSALVNGDGYLRALTEAGRVDVAYVSYVFRGNATAGLLLVNGTPGLVDVNDPAQYKDIAFKKDPAYAGLAKGEEVEIWADDPAAPVVESTSGGGQRFTFALPLKKCHACDAVGVAVVDFDFDASGKFLGTHFEGLKAASAAARN
jgi:hypothetical protein